MALSLNAPNPGNQGTVNPAMDTSGAIVNNGPMPAPSGRVSSFVQGTKDAPQMDFAPCASVGCMCAASPVSPNGTSCQMHGGM